MSLDRTRTGSDLVVESLIALGADVVFGLPGQHAIGLFDAVARSGLRYVGLRVENNAGFAADGYARTARKVAPLILSTGPGALTSLPALQEAAAASVPVLAISSQVPSDGLGGRRKGHLHELVDQQASFRPVVKSVHCVRTASQIPSAIAAAWESALSVPAGPVWIEVPQDVLVAETTVPLVRDLRVTPRPLNPRAELVDRAAAQLAEARRPAIIAGGGVVRADAHDQLLRLAEKLRAPVVCTFGAKGAFPWQHPLSLQSWLEDRFTTELLEDADALLVVGSGLGELSSNYHTFAPRGRVIQVDADLGKLEANHPALGIHADAAATLSALAEAVPTRTPDGRAESLAADLLKRIDQRIAGQGLELERRVLAAVRAALPDQAQVFFDMTILGYWAWSAWDARRPRGMDSAQGAGGLGYAFPAALGAAVAGDRHDAPQPVLAVSGDRGAMYSIAELATARQHQLPVTWLIVDDGGYGILREYMTSAYGQADQANLVGPDFVRLAESFGVPAVLTTPDRLQEDLSRMLHSPGPAVVVLPAGLRMFQPTHLSPGAVLPRQADSTRDELIRTAHSRRHDAGSSV